MIRDEHLEPLLRTAPWLPGALRAAQHYTVADQAALGPGETLLVVAAHGGRATGERVFVPVRTTASGDLVSGAHGVDAPGPEAVRHLLTGRRLRTERGGHLHFRRAAAAPTGDIEALPFDQGWSSNSLARVGIGGAPYMYKTYRQLGAAPHEPEVLRLMSGSGHTPHWAGDCSYTEPSGARRYPWAVLYRHAAGHGIDTPLRENLRSLWPRLTGHTEPDRLVRAHLRPLAGKLRETGVFLGAFHRDLAARLGDPATGYPVHDALADASQRLRTPADFDTQVPHAAQRAALDALRNELRLLEREFEGRRTAAGAGPCHGDLHLSHLLCADEPGGGWRMRVIDLSTPALPADGAAYAAQSPVQDLVAVRRALEYFAADEAAFESARRLGVEATLTMNGSLDGAPGLPPARRRVLERVFETADVWREHVLRLLLGPPHDTPLRRLLYLRRLLHELAYNHDHARPYHAAIDLRHALALARRDPTTPART